LKAVVQRVRRAEVRIGGRQHAAIGPGILVYLGVHEEDSESDSEYLADKCSGLRIFEDGGGKMNLSVGNIAGSVLVVSQFTLYGDARKGNRPNFMSAAKPEKAETLYGSFVRRLASSLGPEKVKTGVFREMMDIESVNDGPVTIIIESRSHD